MELLSTIVEVMLILFDDDYILFLCESSLLSKFNQQELLFIFFQFTFLVKSKDATDEKGVEHHSLLHNKGGSSRDEYDGNISHTFISICCYQNAGE